MSYRNFGRAVAIIGLTLMPGLLSGPAFAKGHGSHEHVRMCARVEYTYLDRQNHKHSGTTRFVRCGRQYLKTHEGSKNAKASREEACAAAWQDLPKLSQGERWLKRSCKPFQSRA